MKKTIVIHYSNNGSNRFLANKIKEALWCDIEEIRPVVSAQLILMMGIIPWIKKIKAHLKDYERVILVGPIWMGKFVAPLKSFVSQYKDDINELVFVTCCGSSYAQKDDKFGHGLVFKKAEEAFGRPIHCEALPISLVLPEENRGDSQLVMSTRLGNENFCGEMAERFERFVERMKG